MDKLQEYIKSADATCIECAEAKLASRIVPVCKSDATCIECAEAKPPEVCAGSPGVDATCIECAEAKPMSHAHPLSAVRCNLYRVCGGKALDLSDEWENAPRCNLYRVCGGKDKLSVSHCYCPPDATCIECAEAKFLPLPPA